MQTTTFDTLEGNVVVYLPDDPVPGDQISGAVVVEPNGASDEARAANAGVLSGLVVDVGTARESAGNGRIGFTLATAATLLTVKLLDREGREVGKSFLPCHGLPPSEEGTVTPGRPIPAGEIPRPAPQAGDYRLPRYGQAGRPVILRGPFDGNFANSSVWIGGDEAKLLAESPRELVVSCPQSTVGPTSIELREGPVTAKGDLRVVALSLAAPKTTLKKGERTTLTVRVDGLHGLGERLPLFLTNRSSSVVRLQGGNEQRWFVGPGEVLANGAYIRTLTLTGVTVGNFVIYAFLGIDLCPDKCSPKGSVANRSESMTFTAVGWTPQDQATALELAKLLTWLPRKPFAPGGAARAIIDALPGIAQTRGFDVWVRVCCDVCEETSCWVVWTNLEWARHCSSWTKVMSVAGMYKVGENEWVPTNTSWEEISKKAAEEAKKITCPP